MDILFENVRQAGGVRLSDKSRDPRLRDIGIEVSAFREKASAHRAGRALERNLPFASPYLLAL